MAQARSQLPMTRARGRELPDCDAAVSTVDPNGFYTVSRARRRGLDHLGRNRLYRFALRFYSCVTARARLRARPGCRSLPRRFAYHRPRRAGSSRVRNPASLAHAPQHRWWSAWAVPGPPRVSSAFATSRWPPTTATVFPAPRRPSCGMKHAQARALSRRWLPPPGASWAAGEPQDRAALAAPRKPPWGGAPTGPPAAARSPSDVVGSNYRRRAAVVRLPGLELIFETAGCTPARSVHAILNFLKSRIRLTTRRPRTWFGTRRRSADFQTGCCLWREPRNPDGALCGSWIARLCVSSAPRMTNCAKQIALLPSLAPSLLPLPDRAPAARSPMIPEAGEPHRKLRRRPAGTPLRSPSMGS